MLERGRLTVIREVERPIRGTSRSCASIPGSITSRCWWLRTHRFANADSVTLEPLGNEMLITDPVETDRLDISNPFLTPAGIVPRRHQSIETTRIMLQRVASGRGVAALPRWLADE